MFSKFYEIGKKQHLTQHPADKTGTVYNPWTAALKYSPQPINVFMCFRIQTVEPGCSIDHTAILIGQHLYPDPAQT